MDMLEYHKETLKNSKTTKLHDFYIDYRNYSNNIYAFVEGKDDFSYYKSNIQNKTKNKFDVCCYLQNNKQSVICAYENIDWSVYSREQIVFFVDKDYSDFLDEKIPVGRNFYITDGYSIENSIVSKNLCEIYLKDCKKMHDLSLSELYTILNIFEEEIKKFYDYYLDIASYIIAWRKRKLNVYYDCLKLDDIFYFEKSRLKLHHNDIISAIEIFCKCVNKKNNSKNNSCLDINTFKYSANEIKKRLIGIDPKKYVIGKHEIWFVVRFCEYIHQHPQEFSQNIINPQKPINLSINEVFKFFANKIIMPNSLEIFLEDTVCKYISNT